MAPPPLTKENIGLASIPRLMEVAKEHGVVIPPGSSKVILVSLLSEKLFGDGWPMRSAKPTGPKPVPAVDVAHWQSRRADHDAIEQARRMKHAPAGRPRVPKGPAPMRRPRP